MYNASDTSKEVEFKLLLDDVYMVALQDMSVRHWTSEQTYIESDVPGSTRITKKVEGDTTTYIWNNKQDVDDGLTRLEDERVISEEEALRFLEHPLPGTYPVRKSRFIIPVGTHTAELDVYSDYTVLSAVVEFELDSSCEEDAKILQEEARVFDLIPPEFPARVVADVTRIPEFKNAQLAKGFPERGLVGMYYDLMQTQDMRENVNTNLADELSDTVQTQDDCSL